MEFQWTQRNIASKPSRNSYFAYQNNSFSDSSFGMNIPFSFGQTQCSSRLNPTRQTTFTTSAIVPIISLETSNSSFRSSACDQQYDQIPFEMVDGHKSFRSSNSHSPYRPQCIPLYGCQSIYLVLELGAPSHHIMLSLAH